MTNLKKEIETEINNLEQEIKKEKGEKYLEGYYFTNKEVNPMLRLECLKAKLEGYNQALLSQKQEEIKFIDEFFKKKIKWACKPETMLNKALVSLLETWNKELKQKLGDK